MRFTGLASLMAALAGTALSQGTMSLNSTLSSTKQLSMLATLLNQYPSLVSTLANASDITILAPSNSALKQFTKMMGSSGMKDSSIQDLLMYHVIDGLYYSSDVKTTPAFVPTIMSTPKMPSVVELAKQAGDVLVFSGLLQNSTVTTADVNFTGGVVHIIDTVLTPPESIADTALAANLTAFAGAVDATGLSQDLKKLGNCTIFAPSNEAFEAVAATLSKASMKDITDVLSYHVVSNEVLYSTNFTDGAKVKTVEGATLEVTVKKGLIYVNSAQVVVPDIIVDQGVVHVIDNVLNPASTSAPPASATTGMPAFKTGTSMATEVPFTSGLPKPSTTIMTSMAAPAGATGGSGAMTKSSGAAMPMKTAAVQAAALFGAGAAWLNY